MRLALAAALVLLAACALPPDVAVLKTQCSSYQRPLDSLVIAGEQADVKVGLGTQCRGGFGGVSILAATSVSVQVTDPDGLPALHSEQPVSAMTLSNETVVSFLPTKVGSWHVTVDFLPKVGRAEYDVYAVERRMGATSTTVAWELPKLCAQYDVTDHGTAVCWRHGTADIQLLTHRGQLLTGVAFALDHDTLWRLTGTALERMTDDGVSFQMTHQLSNAGLAAPLVAQGGDVLLVEAGGLLRVHPEANGTLTTTSISVPAVSPDAISAGATGLLLWSSNTSTNHTQVVSVSEPGGTPISTELEIGYASWRLAGSDEKTLWAYKESWTEADHVTRFNLVAISAAAQPAGMLQQPGAPLPGQAEIAWSDPAYGSYPPVVPMSQSRMGEVNMHPKIALPRSDGRTVTFELLDPGEGFDQVISATPSHAFAPALDGKSLKIFDR